MKTLIIIPSRMSATRLPGKPLLKINGLSIISHVFKKAESSNIGEVVVATEDQEILDDVKSNGGNAILTSKNHRTGTDRIYEALKMLDRNDIDLIMNIQGDEPEIDIEDIKKNENIFHHIGIYCYEVETLKNFVSFNQSKNELDNKLEQLRALDNKIDINVAQANSSPIGIDTKEDYLAIKKIIEYK